jgi:hypothetical protein
MWKAPSAGRSSSRDVGKKSWQHDFQMDSCVDSPSLAWNDSPTSCTFPFAPWMTRRDRKRRCQSGQDGRVSQQSYASFCVAGLALLSYAALAVGGFETWLIMYPSTLMCLYPSTLMRLHPSTLICLYPSCSYYYWLRTGL